MVTADSLNRKGAELYLQGDVAGARLHYAAALQLDPGFHPALANMSVALSAAKELKAAAVCSRRLLSVAPDDGRQWRDYGRVLVALQQYEAAHDAMLHAVERCPGDAVLWYELGQLCLDWALQAQDGRPPGPTSARPGQGASLYDEALSHMSRAEALGTDPCLVQYHRALVLLSKGQLGPAFELYETRKRIWPLMGSGPWDPIPEWQGEDLKGKRILLHGEQGFGDIIMSSRFVRDVAKLGARVTFGVAGSLRNLFGAQGWDVEILDSAMMSEPVLRRFDVRSSLYSALRWLNIEPDRIDPRPYLRAPKMALPRVSRVPGSIHVGICWASGTHGDGAPEHLKRHAPLEDWVELAENPRVQLHSLQKGQESGDIKRLGLEPLIRDHTACFDSWADTATYVQQLDLVISVDTAVAHLAAALGKPTWMVSQFRPCWRWWNLWRGSGEPWYETMTIFDQPLLGDWKGQIRRCAEKLRESAAGVGHRDRMAP